MSSGKARAVLAVVPLVAGATLLFGSATELLPIDDLFKITLARLLIVAGLASILVLYGLRRELFITGLEIPIALLLIFTTAATFKAGMGGSQIRFLYESVALFYLVVALCRTDRDAIDALALVALVGVAAAASEGVSQFAQGEPTGFYRVGFTPVTELAGPPDGSVTRAIGSFSNPNLLATCVLLLAPIAALSARVVRTMQLKVVVWGLICVAGLALILTFSRAGIGAALLGGTIALYTTKPAWRPRILIAFGIAVAALAVGVIFSSGKMVSGFGRPRAYSTAFEVIGNNWLFGVGPGRAADALNAAFPKSSFRHAHNFWLTWWVDAGTVGFLSIAWISLALFVKSLRGALASNRYSVATLVALVGFFAFSMLDHPANVNRIATIFWIVAAIAVAAPSLSLAKDHEPKVERY